MAFVIALTQAGGVLAQTTAAQSDETPAEQAGAGETGKREQAAGTKEEQEITVTGTRISRAGFDQPTPTTVIGDAELRQGQRSNVQEVLNDLPQVRPSVTTQSTPGQSGGGTAPVDLRGLGTNRTLTLLNGRRFIGENNLNLVPFTLVDRVEIVTGGASAAYGSNAVAGVVNIILKRNLEGITLGAQTGISSRGDSFRYQADGAFGTGFADGNGRLIAGVEYVNGEGIPDRNSRRNLGSAGIVRVNPGDPLDQRVELVRDVNLNPFGQPTSVNGLIRSGVLAGQVFNQDGSLRPFNFPDARGVGGESRGLFDDVPVTIPSERLNAYSRVSYDVGSAEVWADASYVYSRSKGPFLVDFFVPTLTIQATNPFLQPDVRNRLAAAGQTSFQLNRLFTDVYLSELDNKRTSYEGAVGITGQLGDRFKYTAHYSHGEIEFDSKIRNFRSTSRFNNAINAVRNSAGQIVCGINADAVTTNDDPACAPINPFGAGNISQPAAAYTTGVQGGFVVQKLDSASAELEADLFSLWAGPITAVVGAEARKEQQDSDPARPDAADFGSLSLFTAPVSGDFSVKEAFAEVAVPVIDIERRISLDLNGAARYSDFSTSGGIWSWKVGGAARLFNDLLLRATRSRDIRSPSIPELFNTQSILVQTLVDQDVANRLTIPGFNRNPVVSVFSGGNPNLVPETAKTLTVGGSFSPSFVPGFDFSVDYYKIDISGAIGVLSAADFTRACALGNAPACNAVIRDPVTQTVVRVNRTSQNIASFKQSGIDIEASYLLPLSRLNEGLGGTLRVRALANHVIDAVSNNGLTETVQVGNVTGGLFKWRGVLSFTYQDDVVGLDARLRYQHSGLRDPLNTNLINNRIGATTYVDIGAQFKVNDRFTFFGNVNNVFDVDPPIFPAQPAYYDVIGTYFTAGARIRF